VAAPRDVLIGRITGVHGLDGSVKVRSYSDSPDLLAPGRRLRAEGPNGAERFFEVRQARRHGPALLLGLGGITDRGGAEAVVGWELFVERQALPEPEPGTYYWDDLIGMEVVAVGGERVGRLESIFRTGSNDVYVVAEAGRELLVPALRSVVAAVDLTARRIVVDLPEGLEWS
jgi:16S rRNA processing protein RimM